MNRWLLSLVVAFSIAGVVSAEEYEIAVELPDLFPGDGLFEAGSITNPYVGRDESGQRVFEMHPSVTDLRPGDGLFEAGSATNPYVIEFED